jgi:hypothetical protein
MAGENAHCLEARVWVNAADGPALIGERVRQKNGILTVIWHVDPETILGVIWVEIVGGIESQLSKL